MQSVLQLELHAFTGYHEFRHSYLTYYIRIIMQYVLQLELHAFTLQLQKNI